MKNRFAPLLILLAGCAKIATSNGPSKADTDRQFDRIAKEYLTGYLAWRPQTGTSLGFHQYDGKLTDFGRRSLDRELNRLKQFDEKLAALKSSLLSPWAFYDFRILQAAIKSDRFKFEAMQSYTKNPMTYADVIDVNIYIKRDFAPLEARVQSIIEIGRAHV